MRTASSAACCPACPSTARDSSAAASAKIATTPAALLATTFSDRIERRRSTDEDLAVGHSGRAERVIHKVVLGQQRELRPRLNNGRHAVFVRDVDLAVGQHGRAAVGGVAEALGAVHRLAGGSLQAI